MNSPARVRPTPVHTAKLAWRYSALASSGICAALLLASPVALAQNITTVNGKAVPVARAEAIINQMTRSGQQPRTPDMEARAKEEAVVREILEQEAEKRGIQTTETYRTQVEMARQTIMIQELIADFRKKMTISDDEYKAEYDKAVKAQGGPSKEYRARHILVEKEALAKQLTAQLKKGGKFEDLAKKHSKDPGSAQKGGDLDFARPDNYVPEFGKAMTALKKGDTTENPVKSQFGWHIIKLEDVRDAALPPLEQVKPQLKQRIEGQKTQDYVEGLRSAAKTDFKFTVTAPAAK
jgi:peptidyl-prolyl cis-trans isomerase C